jgi:hypothetical protein
MGTDPIQSSALHAVPDAGGDKDSSHDADGETTNPVRGGWALNGLQDRLVA